MNKKKILFLSIAIIMVITIVLSVLLVYFNMQSQDKVDLAQDDIGEIIYYHTELEHIATNEKDIMYADNEILLVANDDAKYTDIEKLAKKHNAVIVGWIEQTGDYQLKLDNTYTIDELNKLIESLNKSNYVNSAYINFASQIDCEKTEERDGFFFGDEWESDLQNFNNCKGDSWGIEAIEVLASWDVLDTYKKNVKPVKIGLIDSAFDTEHEDLGFAETFYNVGTGRDHGTHVAGTMAAKTNNNEGICGVYPYGDGNLYGVSYSGICNYSENGSPITTSMFLKIAYAELILRDVKVINSSLGFNYYKWPLTYTDPEWNDQVEFLESNAYILGDFLDRLLDKGYDFVLVNAAGNDSNRNNNVVYDSKYSFWTTVISEEAYPDVYNRIIVVGAVNSDYDICNFSNGGDRVDIYAPGDTIFSTVPNNNYENKDWSGTSMAAPHVSGVAAMVWSANNDLTGAQVKEIVCGNHSFRCNSCDMVDAYMAVQEAAHMNNSNDSINPENGGILCWVVSVDDVDTKIQNATVTATNTQTGKEITTTTDSFGHFELFVPAGTYTLSVQAEGYEDFIWPNDREPYTIPIIVQNNNINYLDDWIKMHPDNETNNIKQTLIEQYGLASQEQFVSCLGSEIQTYPSGICGIVSMIDLDINNDKTNELFVLRVSQTNNTEEAQIIAEVYQTTGSDPYLCTSQTVYNISFCTASNIYLFYSDILSKYCIMVDSYSSGSYTGVNSWSAKVYTITNNSIDEYRNWESVPFVGINADFESEFKTINAPYAKYCTTFDNRNNTSYYQPLCEVEHEIFGDPSTYMTRNHKLKIKSSTGRENTTADDNSMVVDCYKTELLNHPESISHTYGTKTVYVDTEYTVYDIDKDGVFELIIKEDSDNYFVYTYDNGECKQCGKFYWNYADCLYEYNENGLVVYDGGVGSLHLEYVYLYSLSNGVLNMTDTIISSEEYSLEEVRSTLEDYTAINDFYPISDYTLLIP